MKLYRSLCLTGLAITASLAFADAAPVVESLYDTRSWIPGFYIPIRVSASSGNITAPSIESEGDARSASCGFVADPFTPTIYLVRCLQPAKLWFKFNVIKEGKPVAYRFGPLMIQNPADMIKVPPKDDDIISTGQALFTRPLDNGGYACASCHFAGGPAQALNATNASLKQIKAAFVTYRSSMPSYVSSIPEADLKQMAAYLGTL